MEDHPDLTGLVRRLLTMLLPRLTHAGPATPVYDAAGRLACIPTEPIQGVPLIDLPRTVQGLVLCTAVLKTGKRRPERVSVNAVGECNISGPERTFAEVDPFDDPVVPEFAIAGRPASLGDEVVVEL